MQMTPWEAGDVPTPTPAAAWRNMGGQVVLVHIGAAQVMGLNATGGLVWSLIDGQASIGEIAVKVAAQYQMGYEPALSDVVEFVDALRNHGLICSQPR